MKKNILSLVALVLLALSGTAPAQISPTISVQGTNATLPGPARRAKATWCFTDARSTTRFPGPS